MNTYEKPCVLVNDELAEGVYAASGGGTGGGGGGNAGGGNCFTISANKHQSPQQGRGDYRIQLSASHNATDGHHSSGQTVTVSFNQNVEYSSSNGQLLSGSGTPTLTLSFGYHGNATENIGLGDLVVTADAGLTVTGSSISCNGSCSVH